MNVSVNDDVQLKKSENAWKPGLKRECPAEDTEMQKTRVRLNIYTDMCTKTHKRYKDEELSIKKTLYITTRLVFINN